MIPFEIPFDHPMVGVALIALVWWAVYALVSLLLKRFRTRGSMKRVSAQRIRMAVRWLLTLVLLPVALQTMGYFEGAWGVVTSFVAVGAVALVANWSVLSNGVNAIALMVFQPFSIGDVLEVMEVGSKEGIRGRVTDLSLLYTQLEVDDLTTGKKARLSIPNNVLIQKSLKCLGDEPSVTAQLPAVN